MRIYPTPRLAMFNVENEPAEFETGTGWKKHAEPVPIIGEEESCYITKCYWSMHGMWMGPIRAQRCGIRALGIHKSRFIKFLPTQTTLPL